jgi:hypothetical protein
MGIPCLLWRLPHVKSLFSPEAFTWQTLFSPEAFTWQTQFYDTEKPIFSREQAGSWENLFPLRIYMANDVFPFSSVANYFFP